MKTYRFLNLCQIFLLPLLMMVFLAGTSASAQSDAYSDGKAAGLTAAQVKKLTVLRAAVAIPTYLPAGFKLKAVRTPKPPLPSVVDYYLDFANAKGKTFTIQSTNDGIGDMFVKDEVSGKNAYFDGEFYAGRDEEDSGAVGAQWIGSLKKYQPRGQKITQYYSLTSEGSAITPQEAAKIMKSLRYLKR